MEMKKCRFCGAANFHYASRCFNCDARLDIVYPKYGRLFKDGVLMALRGLSAVVLTVVALVWILRFSSVNGKLASLALDFGSYAAVNSAGIYNGAAGRLGMINSPGGVLSNGLQRAADNMSKNAGVADIGERVSFIMKPWNGVSEEGASEGNAAGAGAVAAMDIGSKREVIYDSLGAVRAALQPKLEMIRARVKALIETVMTMIIDK